ncbi:conserved hypothetical protein, membrane [Candidatus Omnitrophus magneticus]|uniref:Uncharacterized protein n=1 Tax=Candidatus Omnitrophus magneticus TaxID=1609969 RepID=A0A0F0CS11_9BACT|nr:conserved hypothetical protein, membrane [Candidatus Omnitrophus magneticus]
MKSISFFKQHKLIIIFFFIVFFLAGLSIYKDYGISWDEKWQRDLGTLSVDYVFKGDRSLLSYKDKYYGPVFEMLLVAVERVFNLTSDSRILYFSRHLVTFIFFYISVIFFYKLCRDKFKSWQMGLLGAVFLVLSPRIFAHAFYNSKDLPFLSVFIISIYTLFWYLERKSFFRAFCHALVCGILIDIRIMGIMVPLFTVFAFSVDFLAQGRRENFLKNIFSVFVYCLFLVIFIILFWPMLWESPVHHFIMAFKEMSKFPWQNHVLYMGKYIPATNLPWHYLSVWIIITTPIVYFILFFVGLFADVKECILAVKEKRKDLYIKIRDGIIFLSWFFAPIIAVIVLKSVVYDEWRQVFYIYPAFIIIALSGVRFINDLINSKLKKVTSRILWQRIFIGAILVNIFSLLGFMINAHPYENLYFNRFAGKNLQEIKHKYELDYWGTSYRKGLEYILEHDKRAIIKVLGANTPVLLNAFILPEEDKKRIKFVETIDDAEYFISNYRWHHEDYPIKNKEVYSVERGGAKVMTVFKR